MLEPVEFKKTREFGELINDTFLFLRQNFKPLLKVFIYLCGFFMLAGMATSVVNQLGMKDVMFDQTIGFATRMSSMFNLTYLIAIIFIILNYNAITLTVYCYIALYIEKGNKPPEVEEVWAYFKFYFVRSLLGTLLMSAFLTLAFVLCLVPGIYVFPAVSLFFPIMLNENGSIGYSFSRSFKLLKGQWWSTLAVLIIIWVITYACTLFVYIPTVIFGMIRGFTQDFKSVNSLTLVLLTVVQYIGQVFLILPLICSALVYFNLRERQENFGLLERIDKLGNPNENLNPPAEEY
jgi:hypothetical protein